MLFLLALLSAQESDRAQLVDIEYRYVPGYRDHYDRRNLSTVTVGISDLFHAGLSDSDDDTILTHLLKYGIAAYLDGVVDAVGHEYGHASAESMIGKIHPTVFRNQTADPQPASLPRLFLRGLEANQLWVGLSADDWGRVYTLYSGNPTALANYQATGLAGGLNQEQATAARYTERYLDGRLSFMDCIPLLWETFSSIRTGLRRSNDLWDYATNLRSVGVNTSANSVMAVSCIRLASGSVIQATIELFGNAFSSPSDGVVPRLSMDLGHEWRASWLEFESYMTQKGPTAKAILPFGTTGVEIRPSLEQSFGRGELEGGITLSFYSGFFKMNGAGFFHGTEGAWLETSVVFSVLGWLALYIGYQYGTGYSFHREVYGANLDGLHPSEASPFFGIDVHHRF